MFEVMIKMWKILLPRLISVCSRAELSGAVYDVSTSISRLSCFVLCFHCTCLGPHISLDTCNDMKNIQPLLCVFCTKLIAMYVSRHVCSDTYACAFNSLVAFLLLSFLLSSRLLSMPALICVRPSVFFSHYPASCMCSQP